VSPWVLWVLLPTPGSSLVLLGVPASSWVLFFFPWFGFVFGCGHFNLTLVAPSPVKRSACLDPEKPMRTQEDPPGGPRGQGDPGGPGRTQEDPGGTRTQEDPGGPRGPSGPRRTQEDPGGPRRTQQEDLELEGPTSRGGTSRTSGGLGHSHSPLWRLGLALSPRKGNTVA
jgi:hypothetical protein